MNAPKIVEAKGKDELPVKDGVLDKFLDPRVSDQPLECELHKPDGSVFTRRLSEKPRELPIEICYDTRGLELYEKVTETAEYYLTRCEREILTTKGNEMAEYIPDGAAVIELGCGSMSKTKVFLDHIRKAGRRGIRFFGVDIDRDFLQTSLQDAQKVEIQQQVPEENRIEYTGLYGSYTDILDSCLGHLTGPRVWVWLGSSVSSFTRPEASKFLKRYSDEGMREGDLFFMGIDTRKTPKVVATAYDDPQGCVKEFILNGLNNLNSLLGDKMLDRSNFEHVSGYNDQEGRIEVYYSAREKQVVTVPGSGERVELQKDELIQVAYSYKYSDKEIEQLAASAGLVVERVWRDPNDYFKFFVMKKASTSAKEE